MSINKLRKLADEAGRFAENAREARKETEAAAKAARAAPRVAIPAGRGQAPSQAQAQSRRFIGNSNRELAAITRTLRQIQQEQNRGPSARMLFRKMGF